MDTGTRARSRYALLVLVVVAAGLSGYVGYVLYPRFTLPAAEGAGLFLLAASAGVAAFFSPCAFPLLVTLLARETATASGRANRHDRRQRALVFAAALAIGAASFLLLSGAIIAFGGAAAFSGVTFTSTAGRSLRLITGAVLISFGLVQLGFLSNPLRVVGATAKPFLRRQAGRRQVPPAAGFGLFGFAYLLAGFG